MNDLFIQFGVQAGGGPAFLKRTRTAYSYNQLQRQNSSGVTYSQLQRRDGTGQNFTNEYYAFQCQQLYPTYFISYTYGTGCTVNPFAYGCGYSDYGPWGICDQFYRSTNATTCHNAPNNRFQVYCGSPSDVGKVRYEHKYQGTNCAFCCEYHEEVCQFYSFADCTINWGGWYNVGSCSTVSPGCTTGAQYVGCQTVTLCYWNVTQSWYNVTSCSASTPSCTNGASRIECRTLTLYDWNPWSEYEEVDICVPQSPAAGAGAVQIECVPQ
jgi:hypothetical protein